jgi:hypothetical protein
MKPDIGLIADAALIALHENARRVERVALRMPPGADRDELVWIVEAMMTAGDTGRQRISEIAKRKR